MSLQSAGCLNRQLFFQHVASLSEVKQDSILTMTWLTRKAKKESATLTAVQTASIKGRMITSVLNLKDTHIVCPSKTTRLL